MADIGGWLTEKAGPLPRWGWLAAGVGAGLVYLVLKNRSKAAANAATTTTYGTSAAAAPWPAMGGIGDGSGGTGTTIPPAPAPPVPQPVGPASVPPAGTTQWPGVGPFSADQYMQLTDLYNSTMAKLLNLQSANAVSAAAAPPPAPSTPASYAPPVASYPNPFAGLQTPTQVPAYVPPIQPQYVQQPPPPYFMPGGLPGLGGAVQGAGRRLVQYIGGPLNGQWLPG